MILMLLNPKGKAADSMTQVINTFLSAVITTVTISLTDLLLAYVLKRLRSWLQSKNK